MLMVQYSYHAQGEITEPPYVEVFEHSYDPERPPVQITAQYWGKFN